MTRLLKKGRLARVAIDDLPRREFYVRRGDLPALEAAGTGRKPRPAAAFIAPLDNLMWDGDLVETLFDFVYAWEVYKPASARKWGYYVLPVLVGDRLAARFDPAFSKTAKLLTIQNWWWEEAVDTNDDELVAALQECLRQFCKYLGADSVKLGEKPKRDPVLRVLASAV